MAFKLFICLGMGILLAFGGYLVGHAIGGHRPPLVVTEYVYVDVPVEVPGPVVHVPGPPGPVRIVKVPRHCYDGPRADVLNRLEREGR